MRRFTASSFTTPASGPKSRGRRSQLLALGLAVVVGLALAACASDKTAASDPNGAPTATPGPTPTATPRAGQATAVPPVQSTTDSSDGTATETPAGATPTPTESIGGIGAPIVDPGSRATVRDSECEFDLPADTSPRCYRITVPERWWESEDSTTVDLAVAVFSATGPNAAPDPLVYFEGGPGGHTFDLLSLSYQSLFAPLAVDRDIVFFDQRGVGSSAPQLSCDEVEALFEAEPFTVRPIAEEEQDLLDGVAECAADLLAAGVDISQFNSVASATDAEAIRAVLGYDDWNILGISYGTRLGQTAMRMYPDSIRSVILDSIVPNADDRPAVFAPNAAAAFERLFAECLADSGCSAAYPNLEERFFAMVDAWDESPVQFEGLHPLTLEPLEFHYTGDDLLGAAFGALYGQASFAALPELVAQVEREDYGIISLLASVNYAQNEFFTAGVFVAVGCAEEDPFSNAALVDDLAPQNPYYERFADDFNGSFFFEVCDAWGATAVDAVENELVRSDIPTLLMGGAFDPITPASATDAVAEGLVNSFTVVFPNEGHGVTPTECGVAIASAFLADPGTAPDTSCLAESPAPAWTPNPNQAITMVPFTVDELGASLDAVRPDEWIAQGTGAFARYNTVADPAFLLVQNTFGLSEVSIFGFFAEPLGWDGLPEIVETREVNGESWNIYAGDFSNSSVVAAVSDAGADSIVIIVSGYSSDFPRFLTELFEPVLAAAAPL